MRFMTKTVFCAVAMAVVQMASAEEIGRAFPGNYFAQVGAFYLAKKDYRQAIDMFELSGFWANKVAQYNVGVLYFNGIGNIAPDRIRGTAWLGIAAEQHGDLASGALQSAYDKLTPEERVAAGQLFSELDKKYGDAVALRRATRQFEEERRNVTGSRLGMVGHILITHADGTREVGETFYKRQDQEFSNFLQTQFGHVDIGSVVPLPMPSEVREKPKPSPPTRQDTN